MTGNEPDSVRWVLIRNGKPLAYDIGLRDVAGAGGRLMNNKELMQQVGSIR